MADEKGAWYVRTRGRTLGPFNWAQLESLRDRGQLARFHEVSQDRRSWVSAASLSQLFPHSETGAESYGAAGVSSAPADPRAYGLVEDSSQGPAAITIQDSPDWFYARGGTHHGPIPFSGIQRMVTSGEIGSDTPLWKKGMATWAPADQVPGLQFPALSRLQSARQADYPAAVAVVTPYAHQPPRTSGLAIASLVLGLVWLCGLGSLLATIFGAVALSQISRSKGRLEGKGLAIAGLVLGILGLSLFALPVFTSFLAAMFSQVQRNRF